MNVSKNILLEISGQAANSSYNFLSPALFSKTTLQLSETRIIERTRKMIASRHCEVILYEVDSVEIVEDGVSWLLVLGFFALFFYGLGIIFFILYFFFKYKYLIIRSGSNAQILCISGANHMEKAKIFMEEVLRQSENAKPKGLRYS
ncbi:hypothetical protein [Microcystis aeruginosa]|uniref:Uncharacterized protein n=1 Tax=Microcystis aeruginosa NIES-4285 TaxID=2497681 RepID=A0A402DAD0_MICAE|nr:hypothetical protein [Microcystis aeruginosa]GCE59189.1 hypothetical protein MiAbB_01101 [Microcystis aeruginosa NIES-4285]